jgi:hypothetical protein
MGWDDPFHDEELIIKVNEYLYNNATGLLMRRNDWSYACYITVEGYNKGYESAQSVHDGTSPNGHNHHFTFTDCFYGVYVGATTDVGVLFHKVETENCEYGIFIAGGQSGTVQIADSTFDADIAVYIDDTSSARLLMNNCEIKRGRAVIGGGTFNVTRTDFMPAENDYHIEIGIAGRVNGADNTFAGGASINDNSLFASTFSHAAFIRQGEKPKTPEFPVYKAEPKTPAKDNLFIVTDFGAAAGRLSASDANTDSTTAVQKALDAAKEAGGGYVYVPAGYYRFDGYLVVPPGVELVGAQNNSSVPHGEGTVFECYYGGNDTNALPFIQLQPNAGVRGITINYPLQIFRGLDMTYRPEFTYPYAIQGQGAGVYVINVGVRACTAALDLFTYKCDDFYVDFLTGHMFDVGVRVGGDSKGGKMSNVMCNVIIYAAGNESKFGSFPNSPAGAYNSNGPLYGYAMLNLEFFIIGDTTGLTMYNCFNFGSYKGITLVNDGNGGPEDCISMGLALDGNTYSMHFGNGITTKNFPFINTQNVSFANSSFGTPSDVSYIYSEGNNDFDITLYTSDYWGGSPYGVYMKEGSGTLTLENAHFARGVNTMLNIEGGTLNLYNLSVTSGENYMANTNQNVNVSVMGGILNLSGTTRLIVTENANMVLAISPEFTSDGVIKNSSLDRSAWRAAASHRNELVGRAFDNDVNSRWDTGTGQVPGMWFLLDLGGEFAFNYIIIDLGSSTGDSPEAWNVQVSLDNENWSGIAAEGQGGTVWKMNERVTARYIRINQTGTKGLYWSIHEIYVVNVE